MLGTLERLLTPSQTAAREGLSPPSRLPHDVGRGPGTAESTVIREQGTWLFFATLVNSGLGFAFWALATRLFSPRDVGIAGSLISLASLGTSISILGMDNGLVRFVTKVDRPRRLVRQLAAIGGSLGFGVGFVLAAVLLSISNVGGAGLLVPLVLLGGTLTMLDVWFQITDASIMAAGRSDVLMVRNTVLGMIKVILVLGLNVLGVVGLLGSYIAPFALVAVIGFIGSAILWPRHNPEGTAVHVRSFAGLSLGNYVSGLVWFLPNRLAPALLLIFSSSANAAFLFLAMTLAEVLNYIPESVGKSIFAHGSRTDRVTYSLMRTIQRWLALIMVGFVILGIVFAGFAMSVLGGSVYEAHALALQLFCIAVLPRTGLQLLKAQFNVERKVFRLVGLGVSTGLSTLVILIIELALKVPVDLIPIAWIIGGTIGLVTGWRLAGGRLPRSLLLRAADPEAVSARDEVERPPEG